MTAKEVNEKWGGKMITALNNREAAIMFGFGLDKDRRLTIWTTPDLSRDELIQQLENIIGLLKKLPEGHMEPGPYNLG